MSVNWSSLTILVVDDQPFIHQLVRPMLRGAGAVNVLRALDATEALRILLNTKVDLALVDHFMAPLDGISLVRHIRMDAGSSTPTLPIILVTGDASQDTLSAGLAAGINDFVCKPFSGKTIVSHVERLLSDPVPFVRTSSYFGPDRAEMLRRHRARQAAAGGDRR